MRDRPADLPVAAPDPASVIEHFLTLRSPAFMDELPRWSDAKKEARAALAALLVERQQDKERIERLTEVGKAAQIVADLNGEVRATYGRRVTADEWGNAMFRLETAVGAARAALAVEEDAAPEPVATCPSCGRSGPYRLGDRVDGLLRQAAVEEDTPHD